MAAEIHLKPEDARSAAADVSRSAAQTQEDVNALKARLAPLADAFRGKTAEAWDSRYAEWDSAAKELLTALDGLGQFLDNAANMIEQLDSDIASQLR